MRKQDIFISMMAGRRRLLLGAFSAMVLVLSVLIAYVFVSSLKPASHTAIHLPIRAIMPGTYQLIRVDQAPVAVFRPTPEMLAGLRANTNKTIHHSAIPEDTEVFVYFLYSTYKGCPLIHALPGKRLNPHSQSVTDIWKGGFVDQCHFGEWDYAGRAISVYDKYASLPDLRQPQFRIVDDVVEIMDRDYAQSH